MNESTDRRNGNLFLWATLLTYLAAPVFYIDVTQAALCDKLGASATVANLPASFSLLGGFASVVIVCLVPHRWERQMASASWALTAGLLGLVVAALILPVANPARIAAVIGECLVFGLLNGVINVYQLQCLARGTTERGRARALKLAFGLGPIAAVAGSLGTQFVLRGGISGLVFPRDFALAHIWGVLCAAGAALCCSRFDLAPMAEEPRPALFPQLRDGFRDYLRSRAMITLWLAYLLLSSALYLTANLSLYTKAAMGREPAEFSGIILAIRFGSKALAGYGLGVLYARYGFRAPLIATASLACLGIIWGLAVPGYLYLGAFGLLGAGELYGVYFPNVVLSWSPARSAPRDLALLSLALPASSPVPALFGFAADRWGFPASFALGGAAALAALLLVLKLPTRKPGPASAE